MDLAVGRRDLQITAERQHSVEYPRRGENRLDDRTQVGTAPSCYVSGGSDAARNWPVERDSVFHSEDSAEITQKDLDRHGAAKSD